MKIYHYNQYGYYCGQDVADESPLEPGVFLIPALATDQEPPVASKDQLVIFVDGVWTIITQLYCFYDNGFKSKIVDEKYIPIAGDVIFASVPTIEELNEAFPFYNSGVPILTLDERLALLEEKYEEKFATQEKLIMRTIASNHLDQEAKKIIYQNAFNELADQKDLEILEILGGI